MQLLLPRSRGAGHRPGSVETFRKLAEALNFTIDDLV
jgi:hypothetical protein